MFKKLLTLLGSPHKEGGTGTIITYVRKMQNNKYNKLYV